jgi:lipoprotein-anchoring transpeptidase ErfK/SrfK
MQPQYRAKAYFRANRLYRLFAGLTIVGMSALAACGAPATTTWYTAAGQAGSADPATQDGSVITAPANNADNVPASTEITFAHHNATKTNVVLTDDDNGAVVDGALRPDGSSWVPEQALQYGRTFTVALTSTDRTGKSFTHTSTFTTMDEPGDVDNLVSQMGDGQEYGVGAPIVLNFSKPIPKSERAAVQRRLFVQTTPPQEGVWNWFADDEVHYRPKDYWKTGTKISLHALFGGLPLGHGLYGGNDITVAASIAPHDLRVVVDDRSKTVVVTQDGKSIKTMPASLGKAGTPSSSGHMVIMTKNAKELFDSTNDGIGPDQPGYYRQVIDDALRLTWGGQYIHSAPWSIDDQGNYDVSHGCTNLSPTNAQWLFDKVHVGDPVTVQNTGSPLEWGDGWTDWDRSWSDYVKGSAIPYTASGSTAPDFAEPDFTAPSPTAPSPTAPSPTAPSPTAPSLTPPGADSSGLAATAGAGPSSSPSVSPSPSPSPSANGDEAGDATNDATSNDATGNDATGTEASDGASDNPADNPAGTANNDGAGAANDWAGAANDGAGAANEGAGDGAGALNDGAGAANDEGAGAGAGDTN